ncbi:MAG: helix-turn-helix transcriptional regulator [Actinomycetota bacterium]
MTQGADGRLGRRLKRILVMLPYAIKHPGVTVDELSRKFGVGKEDLLSDLNLVFMCGLPGYGPGDLIDVTIEDDKVYVRMADYFGSPLRLTPGEALTLYAGAQTLAALPELDEADALKRALDKLGRALGLADDAPDRGVNVLVEPGAEDHLLKIRSALRERRRLELEYLSAGKGELTSRVVDPWGLVAARGHWYLIAFDRGAGDERMFRLDRIKTMDLIEETAEVPEDFDPQRYQGAFRGGSGQQTMTLEISAQVARWFEDYYPVQHAEDLADGWRRVELIVGGERWAASLLLRLGDSARAVEPAAMASAAQDLARDIAQAYRS